MYFKNMNMTKLNMTKLNMYARIALEVSTASTCARVQVGAILLKDGRIIATGWNGSAPGKQHCCNKFMGVDLTTPENKERHGKFSNDNELHAEANLISTCAKNGVATNDTILIVTTSPCSACAKLLIMAGIKEVYYINEYDRDKNGIKLLKDNDIIVDKVSNYNLIEEVKD